MSFLDFPADSVNEKSQLDRVELTDHGVHFGVFSVQNFLVNVDESVHLSNRQQVEVFVNQKEFVLVHLNRFPNGLENNVKDAGSDVDLGVQELSVDEDCNLERVISQTNDEQVDELFVRDLVLLGVQKLLVVVLFAVHLEHNVDVLLGH